MDRKSFLKNSLVATGSLLLGGAAIYRFLNDKEPAENPLPRTIEKIHQGDMKKILVIMSAGTKLGNTDRLTDAYIKGLVERGHSVTKVYLGSMRIEGCRGCGVCQRHVAVAGLSNGGADLRRLVRALAVHCRDAIAGQQARRCGGGAVRHGVDAVDHDIFAHRGHQHHRQHQRQHEIHKRPCRGHNEPLPRGLQIDVARVALLVVRRFARKGAKAADGERADGIVNIVFSPADNFRPHAHGELQHREPAGPRRQIMPQFMDENTNAQHQYGQ